MKSSGPIGLGVAVAIALIVIGGAAFVTSGVYDIGADDHHTAIVLTIIEELRERSIGTRADSIAVPRLDAPSKVTAGAARYSTLCVGCHLAPGVTSSDLRKG